MKHPSSKIDNPAHTGPYCTVAQLAADPSLPGVKSSNIRAWIYHAEDRVGSGGVKLPGNGLASAIVRVGRKVLIDRQLFFVWLETHRMKTVNTDGSPDVDGLKQSTEG